MAVRLRGPVGSVKSSRLLLDLAGVPGDFAELVVVVLTVPRAALAAQNRAQLSQHEPFGPLDSSSRVGRTAAGLRGRTGCVDTERRTTGVMDSAVSMIDPVPVAVGVGQRACRPRWSPRAGIAWLMGCGIAPQCFFTFESFLVRRGVSNRRASFRALLKRGACWRSASSLFDAACVSSWERLRLRSAFGDGGDRKISVMVLTSGASIKVCCIDSENRALGSWAFFGRLKMFLQQGH
jgi:hypothetical protein